MKSATMMMMREKGKFIYKLYRAVTFSLTPLIHLHLRFRKFRGLEHSLRWPERLGRPSLNRPPGPLLWFHAVSLGEGMAAIPVIRRCLTERPDINILMTTTTLAAFEVLKHKLPLTIIYQVYLFIHSFICALLCFRWMP
ncbi:probable 3-deoxy-D-manno-octulosonic acid transferase, mitochondrial [Chenopodium quinoa]|uniref:probable 3-deoxy-D-manno-octulosonic acid transferase, mitochondrial n=1 Tax=Chenopodium quinoa TaxID=63459 RepID=UPI000B7737A3|nr:probable 3-deoxy-D-manno-octulosonic acid transferase, mitochondrial [Chenopodium quinoa]